MLGILAVAYFSYHLVEGDRGLFAYLKLQHEIDRAEAVYQLTENEKQALEKRVALLRPENLDVDMLEERSRDVLGLAHPDEIVIYKK
ncbi:MAG: septum formation initiator [Sneathiella sp.]|nr:septum formation initiator [Sneathiella sp.]